MTTFREDLIERFGGGTEADDTMRELAENGADAGWPGLTYYTDTTAMYHEHADEIWQALAEDADNAGESNPLALIATLGGACRRRGVGPALTVGPYGAPPRACDSRVPISGALDHIGGYTMGVGVSLYRHPGAQGGRSAYPAVGPFSFVDPHDQRRYDVTPERLMYAASVSAGTMRRVAMRRLQP